MEREIQGNVTKGREVQESVQGGSPKQLRWLECRGPLHGGGGIRQAGSCQIKTQQALLSSLGLSCRQGPHGKGF